MILRLDLLNVAELPCLIFIKIVDKDIRIAVGKHLCYIRTVAVRQKLSVNLSAAYDKCIVTAVFFNYRLGENTSVCTGIDIS